MFRFLTLCLLSVLVLNLQHDISPYRKFRKSTTFKPYELTPLTPILIEDLPTNFWWGNVNNTNFLTVQRNQHIPIYCASGWAFASTSALSDRIKIMRKAQWPDINIAPQVLISCDMNS